MERALDCALDAVRERELGDGQDGNGRGEMAELLGELAVLGERAAKSAKGHSSHNPVRIAQVAHTRHDMRGLETEIKLAGAVQKIRRNVAVCRLAEHLVTGADIDKLLASPGQ